MGALDTIKNLLRRRALAQTTPAALRDKYRHLYVQAVEPTADGATFDRARLWRCGALNVLSVRGDRFEMAYQHGRLLADEAGDSLVMASRIASDAIRSSLGPGALGKLVNWYAERGIAEPMLAHGLKFAEEMAPGSTIDHLAEAYGLSEATGIAVDTIIRAALGPETAQTLLGKTSTLAVGGHPAQCTSFAAWGSATADGEMLIGRNTDYPLTGFYDAHPTVIYFDPTDSARRYMAVTSAGFHNAGVCGMNDAGIYVAIHTVPASSVSEAGLPIFMVGQRVLQTVSTFDEAREMLLQIRPAAGWNYHVVSTRERKAASFELCAERAHEFEAQGDFHVTTNHWRRQQMAPGHLFVNATVGADTRARMRRVTEMIEAAEGGLDERSACEILGDKCDPTTGKIRTLPNTIAATTTVSSSVWKPHAGAVFVATGRAPVSQTTFVSVPTIDRFDPKTFSTDDRASIDNAGYARTLPHKASAQARFIEAINAIEHDDDANRAIELLQQAVALDPMEAGFWLALGMMAVRVGRLDLATSSLSSAIETADGPRALVARYVLGRVYAANGETERAQAELHRVTTTAGAEAKLASAAAKAARRLNARRTLPLGEREIAPMLFLADAFRYEGLGSLI